MVRPVPRGLGNLGCPARGELPTGTGAGGGLRAPSQPRVPRRRALRGSGFSRESGELKGLGLQVPFHHQSPGVCGGDWSGCEPTQELRGTSGTLGLRARLEQHSQPFRCPFYY